MNAVAMSIISYKIDSLFWGEFDGLGTIILNYAMRQQTHRQCGHERKDTGHVYVYDIIVKYLLISSSFVAASVSVTLLCFIYKIFYLLLMQHVTSLYDWTQCWQRVSTIDSILRCGLWYSAATQIYIYQMIQEFLITFMTAKLWIWVLFV